MDSKELQQRTRHFALRIIRLVGKLPRTQFGRVSGHQILKSGTSIGANYTEAVYASSRRHFVSLIEIATREAAETLYWLDLLTDAGTFKAAKLADLKTECKQLLAILTASGRTAKRRR